MALEIERKFLVRSGEWRSGTRGKMIRQGYLSKDADRIVRVRIVDDAAFLTVKGRTRGITRSEFEFPIPVAEAEAMLQLCLRPLIEKTRYVLVHAGQTWEIDEFHGENAGLVVAEVELDAEHTAITPPPWLGREVSDEPRYFNSALSNRPFCEWGPDERA
jgi:CYTH domain-containing protein